MGRIPGNLCTELIMNFLNIKSNKNYDLKPIYDVIDNPISGFKKKEPWGYMPSYAITAYKNTHRSYAEFLMKKPDMSLNMLTDILDKLKTTEEKENFSESVAEFYYKEIVINND
jgi:4-hydroxy 2-oxovalerate aldolase